jgi:hypothetical protein
MRSFASAAEREGLVDSLSARERSSQRRGEKRVREERMEVAVRRTEGEEIRSGRRTVVNTRKGLAHREASAVGRNAVPWRGKLFERLNASQSLDERLEKDIPDHLEIVIPNRAHAHHTK